MDAPRGRRVAVVGGGIAGLAAALFIRRGLISAADADAAGPSTDVSLYEATGRVGGKLALGEVAGIAVDLGAEAILARRPEAVALAEAVGLVDDIVHPATTAASIWSRGELHPMPTGHVMGVPGDQRSLAASGLLSSAGQARLHLDRVLPRTPQDEDVAVGKYVASRLGREIVDRLIEPLLGGVYAGHADELSLAATVPQLSPLARAGTPLMAGVRGLLDKQRAAAEATPPSPVFAGVRGGVGRLPVAVERAAERDGVTVHAEVSVSAIKRVPDGWSLTLRQAGVDREVTADAVVLAVPAAAAARLLAGVCPPAAVELSAIEYASVGIVTFALPATAFARPFRGSGFLVPPVDGRVIKAATVSSTKWSWLAGTAPGLAVVRASVGRHDEDADLARDDAELIDLAAADLRDAFGLTADAVDARVTRWDEALPQYAVGHLERVARVRAAVADQPGLAVCGAAYDGVGIPACVASARAAADRVIAALTAPAVERTGA
jgi:oxygen-dependent protoporphyrinogen oxidase